jgi:hypothetical protein
MAEEPEIIREQIEQIRQRAGETMDALIYKANVKEHAKEKLGGMKDAMSDKKDAVVSSIRRATGQATGAVTNGAKQSASLARGNPLLMALGAVAAGFLVGIAIPPPRRTASSGQETDQVKEKAGEEGREALERGQQVAQQVAQNAMETADTHKEQASELPSMSNHASGEAPSR